MKDFLRSVLVVGCFMLTLLAAGSAKAQGFALSVIPSTNQVTLNGSFSFSVVVTNNTGVNLADVLITNIPSALVQFVAITNVPGVINGQLPTSYYTNGVGLVFDFGPLSSGSIADMYLTVQPVSGGLLTNLFQVADYYATNTAFTNIVTQVIAGQGDLSVAINVPLSTVITNDYTYFTLSVTNLGTSPVANVILTNVLAPSLYWFGLTPSDQLLSTNGNSQIFYLGTLGAGAFTNITYEVQPTNEGVFPLTASVGAADFVDANLTNNYATTSLIVTNYIGRLGVTLTATSQVNDQNGLLEEPVAITNYTGTTIPAARLVVSGLTNELFNSVGTNYGNPFVVFNSPLANGQGVQLLLQFSPRGNGSFSLAYNQLRAFALTAYGPTVPSVTTTSTNFNISRIVEMYNGDMLLEFPATLGRNYTVVYSDNVLFSNALPALPPVTAHANIVQWIDYGPPTTLSVPTNAPQRFYRVYLNP